MNGYNYKDTIENLFDYDWMESKTYPEKVTKLDILKSSDRITTFGSIWSYLRELKKYIKLKDSHKDLFFKGYYLSKNCILKTCLDDIQDVIKNNMHNGFIAIDIHINLLKTMLDLPPVIYDFVKWSWIVSIYNLAKENKCKDIITDKKSSFIFDVPSSYFDEKYDKARIKIENAQVLYCFKLGYLLEKLFPEVYNLLNIGIDYKYVPCICFSENPDNDNSFFRVSSVFVGNIDTKSEIVKTYEQELSSIINFIVSAKRGCISFIEEFKMTPTQKIVEDLEKLKEERKGE